MNALGFAWRSLVRQPARATLGVLGVAAVGALLLDMLLLSNGLVLSMRDLLDRVGFDVRVTATDALPGGGPRLSNARQTAEQIAALPSVRSAVTLLFGRALLEPDVRLKADTTADVRESRVYAAIQGAGGTGPHPWTIRRGRDVHNGRELVVNENTARALGVGPGASITVRISCSGEPDALPPVPFGVAGIADFPFDGPNSTTAGTDAATLADSCGGEYMNAADVIMVRSEDDGKGPSSTTAAIASLGLDLRAMTNEEAVRRMQQRGFSYFRQISSVLTAVTLSFALLLIAVLLTVSVNQRLGEIAALRALGFSQRRIVADVLCESSLIVGIGGLLSLPLGALLAIGLDRILKNMPGIPIDLHFFVFQADALILHVALLFLTAILAALYPMRIVARLPIAETLRNEVIS
jgi:putative ABC transport system permease protein